MVVYNLGQQDIIVKDSSVRVNDGKYHVVRFTRDGINSSLQVDDNKVSNIETDWDFHIVMLSPVLQWTELILWYNWYKKVFFFNFLVLKYRTLRMTAISR